MSFFDIGSFKETHVSLETLKAWAGAVASGYLSAGTPPTETLVKIARLEELTPHQVELLACESNKMIHQAKFAAVADKYMAADFPLADSKTALLKLAATGETKLAGAVPDPVFDDHGPSAYEMFGVQPESGVSSEKTASVKAEMRGVERKAHVLREKLAAEAVMAKASADKSQNDFIKEARQVVLQHADTAAERMKVLGQLDCFVKAAEAPYARPFLAKLAFVLGGEGLLTQGQVKTAMTYFLEKKATAVPQELISPFLQGQVVNGSHPLYVTLKTFKDHVARMHHARGNRSVVDDELQVLGERITAL